MVREPGDARTRHAAPRLGWVLPLLLVSAATTRLQAADATPPAGVAPPAATSTANANAQAPAYAGLVAHLASAHNGFAARLYGAVAHATTGNIALSPYAVASALTLLMAATSGTTQVGIRTVLGTGPDDAQTHHATALMRTLLAPPPGVYDLDVANALWIQSGLRPLPWVARILEQDYPGSLRTADFLADPDGSLAAMNRWVATQTHDHIQDLIGSVPPAAALAVTSALWLKISWFDGFPLRETATGWFTTPRGPVSVDLLHDTHRCCCARIPGGVVALRQFVHDPCLVVVIPDDPHGLPALEALLVQGALPGWIAACTPHRTQWTMPRLSLVQQNALDLLPALLQLGMVRGAAADAADLLAGGPAAAAPGQVLSTFVHKVNLRLDEQGLEGSAAVAGVRIFGGDDVPDEIVAIHCDHPFLWAVWNPTAGIPLFLGRIVDPSTGL